MAQEANMLIPPPIEPLAPVTAESLRLLVEQANAGQPRMIERLRRTLDAHPEIWKQFGDLASATRATLIDAIVGNNKLYTESLTRQAAELMQSLLRPAPSAAEKLAAERVVTCWLQVQQADAMCVHFTCTPTAHESSPGRSDAPWGEPMRPVKIQPFSLKESAFWSKQQQQANRQFESAFKLLLTVQQLTPSATGQETARPAQAADDKRQRDLETSGSNDSRTTGSAQPTEPQPQVPPSTPADQTATGQATAPRNGAPTNRILKMKKSAAAQRSAGTE
jgi:hypothetical protein